MLSDLFSVAHVNMSRFVFSCQYDFVEMRDGGTTNSPLIQTVCGTTLPSTLKSTGNVMFVRFRTDNSVPRAGFKAQYQIGKICLVSPMKLLRSDFQNCTHRTPLVSSSSLLEFMLILKTGWPPQLLLLTNEGAVFTKVFVVAFHICSLSTNLT